MPDTTRRVHTADEIRIRVRDLGPSHLRVEVFASDGCTVSFPVGHRPTLAEALSAMNDQLLDHAEAPDLVAVAELQGLPDRLWASLTDEERAASEEAGRNA